MKMIWNVLAIVLLVNLLAAGGFAAWLRSSGRLNRERIVKVVELFKPTLKAERDAAVVKAAADLDAAKKAADLARLEEVRKGPVTIADRLETEQEADELATQRLERLQVEIRDVRDSVTKQNQALAQQKEQLDADRKAFELAKQQELDLRNNADFQRVVATLEKLKPKQAKEILQDLAAQGKTTQVVDYLAAMDLRKASAVLAEYKTPQEVEQATTLIQELRKRGPNLGDKAADPAVMKADANS